MFRTKLDVDRHVQDVFRKLKDESERNLRCYNIAKLYFQVGDYESAKRYVSSYLEVRTESAGAHKLLGQILEALGHKEEALSQYKISLELESRQEDLVLKVCELLADMDVGVDVNRARYWVERADKQFPHHPVVFQLKEKLLTLDKPNNDGEDLKALISSELSVRPKDVQLRVKLLKHYMEKNKLDEAYKHAFEVETTQLHRDDVSWYQVLCDLLTKCKTPRKHDWSFWVFYISSLERFVALTLKEQGSILKKSISEATQALFNFDQSLYEAKAQNFSTNPIFMENMFTHMWGQLHFHVACLILRKTKREQGSWSEAGRLCAPLFLTALHVTPIDSTSPWAVHLKNDSKNQVHLWYKDGSYRCSQSGHVLQDYARDEPNRLLEKIDKFSTGTWRERIFQRIFISRLHSENKTSYFTTHKVANSPLRLCSQNELKKYDEISEEVWPASLHHQIWLGLTNRSRNIVKKNSQYPQQICHLFPELQFSTYNLNQSAPDSLCRLDIDAFLNAAILCSYITIEEQQRSSFLNPERLPTLPADLTNTLCSSVQEKWWYNAYKMYRRQDMTINDDMGEIRQEIQRGLEVVRCIGNHGLHTNILIHLARIFHSRMKELIDKNPEHSDIPALEARCELYWSTAIPLIERLQNNQIIRTSNNKLFDYQGKDMNRSELTKAMEEGQLILVQRYVRNKEYERAIDSLQILKCPEASFEQGKIYKQLADDLVNCLSKESLTSETRSQHGILLTKARSCFYLTLDRLRSPEVDTKHPLNSELVTYIADIENELKRIDPDISRNGIRNDDVLSEDSYSSAHSNEEIPIINTSLDNTVQFLHSSQRNNHHHHHHHRTPKQSSTPCRMPHQDVLELSRNRIEARPSPERLDAQFRQLLHIKDNIIQTVMDQNKALMESNQNVMVKLEELRKEVAELRLDTQKQKPHNLEEDLYFLNDEDYGEYNYQNQNTQQQTTSMTNNIFAQSQRHPYQNIVYPPATLQGQAIGYYQGALPFNDPNLHSSLYAANVYPVPPQIYPRLPVENPLNQIPKIPDSILQQALFPQAQVANQHLPLQQPIIQKIESKEIVKNIPVNKAPPVNVVITSSDTLPTTVPSVQPIMSVTIPPQHRLGTIPTSQISTTPHSYQISMPLQATIPTTVNLPPLAATLTITSPMNKSIEAANQSSTSLNNSQEHSIEIEHDPIPDFMPIIPLPEEVVVTTGEENETTLFSARAKLFRFVDKEWKERGIGKVKLLKNNEGKVRLLMRREQVHKICANHMLTKDMELSSMPSNNKAWIWVANDFADEEVRLEKLCIRFKTEEEAQLFKVNFDNAIVSLPESPAKGKKENKEIIEQKEMKNIDTSVIKVGGLSFSSEPVVVKKIVDDKEKKIQKEETPKVNPFAQFSFGNSGFSSPSTTLSQTLGGITFVKGADNTTPATATVDNQAESPQTGTIFGGAKTIRFPNTSATSSPAANTVEDANLSKGTDEANIADGEMSVFTQKASLMHLNNSSNTWEDKGSGQINLLFNMNTIKLRFLMLNANNTKVCCNQQISSDMKFSFRATSDTVITWVIPNEKTKKPDSFAVTFKSHKLAQKFLESVQSYQQSLDKNSKHASETVEKNKPVDKSKESLSTLFKPSAGSWECKMCYIRNNADKTTCIACDTPAIEKKDSKDSLSNLFKPAADSWECKMCYVRNNADQTKCVACNSPAVVEKKLETKITSPPVVQTQIASGQKSLSELFKPAVGSWTCQGCYMVNKSNDQYCPACDSPKDSSIPPKPKTSIFGTNSDNSTPSPFSFGLPQTNKEPAVNSPAISSPASSAFSFSTLSTNKPKGAGDAVNSTISTIFGGAKKSEPISTNFTFGIPQRPTTPPTTTTEKAYVFGSPGKSFDFQFSAKPNVKSPGGVGAGGETSEDEVVESDDIYFAPVIPLPEKVDVITGEENEEIIYSHRAKLFRFDTNTKEWKERGIGDIKLLKHNETKKLRLIMRRDQILKLCLNHALTSDIDITVRDEKTWTWSAADYSEGEIEYSQFACRFKTPEIAKEFKTSIDNALKGEKNLNNQSTIKTIKPQTNDIEIIYELKVSQQEKEEAQKLKLPENFYSYKYKDDCPGCIGCREPEIPLFVNKSIDSSPIKALDFSKAEQNQKTTEKINLFSFSGSINKASSGFFGNLSTTTSGKVESPTIVEKASANLVFGAPSTIEKKNDDSLQKTLLEKQNICSPSTKLPTSTAAATFSFANSSNTNANPIFGSKPFTGSIFGGNSFTPSQKTTTPLGSLNTDETVAQSKTLFSGFSQNATTTTTTTTTAAASTIFGNTTVAATTPTTPSVFGNATTTTTSIFGNTGTTTPVFGNAATSSLSFSTLKNAPTSGATPVRGFGGTPILGGFGSGTNNSIFGSKQADSTFGAKKTDDASSEKVNFLPTDNAVSFSALAAQSDQNAFKKDPNFAFEGAGSSVFGAKFQNTSSTLNTSKNNSKQFEQDENDNEDEAGENEQEHDPHFEPIIPLPDAIEVRTGEEDEEKMFCQRAKLYRFDSNTKEWKERGVGEMKILHHIEGGTYRILLRREQVHKIVCNMLLNADLDFEPLQTSDRAWIWAGMNYYDGEANLEKLAVRFKNPELASQFKETIDKAQQDLRERPSIKQVKENVSDSTDQEKYDQDEDDDDYVDEGDEEEDFDGEEVEEEEVSYMFEKRATLLAQNNDQTWTNLGMGYLKMFYDSEIFGARIIMEADNTGEIVSNTIISIDTSMQVVGKECMWTAYDYALNPPKRRLLKAVFSSHQGAEEMYMNFDDGQEYAKGAELTDQPEIYIPDDE
ncbi:E3 SUMO-protein ligase RanBP2-like [Leptopilina boulardi]|uniref:E3 SUMO-protein ligase RanBP2-like n=1 Tax=Leptopilina boulardi TaxID=63433 RepID=UPI0021F5CCEC|nr:E3 SUMO-protein ligase RanBP2-like [Leptopilina boulardi]